jgi:hypothetical protein
MGRQRGPPRRRRGGEAESGGHHGGARGGSGREKKRKKRRLLFWGCGSSGMFSYLYPIPLFVSLEASSSKNTSSD